MSAAVDSALDTAGLSRTSDTSLNGLDTQPGASDGNWEQHFLPPPLRLDDHVRAQKIESRLSELVLSGATLRRISQVFEQEMERGLRGEPSSLQMENTYVPELPNGTEEGLFLALDLGGTNFRVLLLELQKGQLVREDVQHYKISSALRLGPGEDLFNYLADCVHDFVRSVGMENEALSLGFTFSFPMRQHSISSGELITWTKSFKCSGMEGVDVAGLLQRCLHARGLRVTVRVLLNDTTGTMMAGAHINPNVGIGVILGTGSNGCYMERAARVRHWEGQGGQGVQARAQDVCVDIEWGAFGDNGCLDFIRTDIDREVDRHSLLATSFTFEKYIGGKYLGDVLRCSLAALAREGLFPAVPPPGSLLTEHLSLFEDEACSGRWSRTLHVLRAECGAGEGAAAQGRGQGAAVGEEDARVAQHVAQLISNRAAQLASVCISVLIRRMDRPVVGVAVDGSVFKCHPRIRPLMDKYIALLTPQHKFVLMPAEDGSGKGSALTAAIAARVAATSSL
ncbi:hexokinase-2-like [Achroia grisella]|uniref:hexokinase-2-like n=1 Tax=Achroia grisella TaxID=688607 RepID=UPI0027D29411|nr:hexokinase-2-like [Achroia grisella]